VSERERVRVEGGGVRCPYCHDAVDTGQADWVACSGCLARHHGECWTEGHRCGACGVSEPLIRGATVAAALDGPPAAPPDAPVEPPRGRFEAFFGAPRRLRLDSAVRGEVGPEAHEDVITEVRRVLGEPGQFEQLGRTLVWRHQVPKGGRDVTVTVAARDGRTTVEIEERLGTYLGALWGGLGGGLGINALVQTFVHGLVWKLYWLPPLGVTFFALLWLLLRTIFVGVARRRRAQLREVAAAVEAVLARHARRPARVDPKKGA
jgi:hypothetical protein